MKKIENSTPYEQKNNILTRKYQLHSIIINSNGSPDYLATNIYYDTLRSWYTPHKLQKEDGTVLCTNKLKTKGIYFSYKKLSTLHGCSTETIRRKLVKLEKLGLIQRSFKHKTTGTTRSYNQLIIYVWKHTPHFFNAYGICRDEITKIIPQTNHEYISQKYKISYTYQVNNTEDSMSFSTILSNMDTKELIEVFSKEKIRSTKSNFKNSVTDKTTKFSNHEKEINENNIQKKEQPFNKKFVPKGKKLENLFDHLTEEVCNILRSNSGRDFTNKAIREIAKSVSKSKKGSKALFYHIKGFIAYLSEILRFEKRDPVKISGDDYYISQNRSKVEKEEQKKESYLSSIEHSIQTSSESCLKRRISTFLSKDTAYNFLTSYQSINFEKEEAIIILNKYITLSEMDKNIILTQIQKTHETFNWHGYIKNEIKSLKVIMPNKAIPIRNKSETLFNKKHLKREGIWGNIRKTFAKHLGSEGDAIDQYWTGHLQAKIDHKSNIINLFAPTHLIKDWIDSHYKVLIEKAAISHGMYLGEICVVKKNENI